VIRSIVVFRGRQPPVFSNHHIQSILDLAHMSWIETSNVHNSYHYQSVRQYLLDRRRDCRRLSSCYYYCRILNYLRSLTTDGSAHLGVSVLWVPCGVGFGGAHCIHNSNQEIGPLDYLLHRGLAVGRYYYPPYLYRLKRLLFFLVCGISNCPQYAEGKGMVCGS